jgi:hypothetical protein
LKQAAGATSRPEKERTSAMRAICGITIAMALACVPVAHAQSGSRPRRVQGPTIEYGTPQELQSVSRIYIDTGGDFRTHEEIRKAVQKALPGLTVTNSADDADVLVVFKTEVHTYTDVVRTTTTDSDAYGTVESRTEERPEHYSEARFVAYVAKQLTADRIRLLLEYDDSSSKAGKVASAAVPSGGVLGYAALRAASPFGRRPPQRFAAQFVKAWREANPARKAP